MVSRDRKTKYNCDHNTDCAQPIYRTTIEKRNRKARVASDCLVVADYIWKLDQALKYNKRI